MDRKSPLVPDHVAAGVNRAVKNSPPPLDDVGGCAEDIADERDPDFHEVVTVPTACALCGVADIDWQAHILSPSHIAVMAAHQMPKRAPPLAIGAEAQGWINKSFGFGDKSKPKKVLSEEHKRKLVEGRERARLARQASKGELPDVEDREFFGLPPKPGQGNDSRCARG